MTLRRLSLAEQIAQLEATAPADYDPEDLQAKHIGEEDEMRLDRSVPTEHYVDVGRSTLRNALPSVADPKYEGVRTSRKQLLEESEEDTNEEDEDESAGHPDIEDGSEDGHDEGGLADDIGRQGSSFSDDELSESDATDEESDDGKDDGEQTALRHPLQKNTLEDEPLEDVASNLKRARAENIEKGKAVKRQLAVWDTLLDTRIRLQKSTVAANRLPALSRIKEFTEASECRDAVYKFLNETSLLVGELSGLQERLATANNIISPPPSKRRKLDAEAGIPEYSDNFVQATEDAAAFEEALHPHVLQTLSKWSAKIQAVAPSALLPSNRGAFLKGKQSPKSAEQLIDDALVDKTKLLERTRTSRGGKSRVGATQAPDAEFLDPQIFDDTDFYQKMLRDIIDSRGNRVDNKDWILLQKQKKAKKKVDTKASKGRKLRFDVHEKLQNFMVPVPIPGAWHDEQVDELFASLLGKGFENVPLDAEEPQVQQNIELAGFRVFG